MRGQKKKQKKKKKEMKKKKICVWSRRVFFEFEKNIKTKNSFLNADTNLKWLCSHRRDNKERS
jgi:hypothetical protein